VALLVGSVAARPRQDGDAEPPVGIDSAGVYQGLSADDLGYGERPRVEDEEPEAEASKRPG